MAAAPVRQRWAWILAAYFSISFLLHFLWEMLQRSLFALPPASFAEHVRMCLTATATGDMAFMLVLYLTAAVIHKDLFWIRDDAPYRHPATWAVAALVGALLAACFELWAVHAVNRWEYGAMPLVPVFQVGWTPLLQMVVVPVLTQLVCWQLANIGRSQLRGSRCSTTVGFPQPVMPPASTSSQL